MDKKELQNEAQEQKQPIQYASHMKRLWAWVGVV